LVGTACIEETKRLIKKSVRRHIHQGYKFGIRVPRTVEEALAFDKENGNTLWYDAIIKEKGNIRVAFHILEPGEEPPPGYKQIPLRMIFDIKMDFTHKARLVAGGHMTDPPSSITYSSVLSRETVRIIFVVAALNELELTAADIGNAYLNAYTTEKVYVITGPEFGHEASCVALIVRALYGLKSSGAAWHDFVAQSLTDLGFISCKSNPDAWYRPAVKFTGEE
jgi:Reverse transcriptase (RNA-dependent DNA polymerase)